MTRYDHEHFEALFRNDADPWAFRSSPYEQAKYAATMAALRRDRYEACLELGCANGELTRRLAATCTSITAVDTAFAALAQARRACAALSGPRFVQAHLPGGDWAGSYDLIVISELLYYLTEDAVAGLAARLRAQARPDTEWLLVHWTGDTDYPLPADRAVELFMTAVGPKSLPLHRRTDRYRMDGWESA